MTAQEAHAYLDSVYEFKMRCLARWFLDHFNTKEERLACLARIRRLKLRSMNVIEADQVIDEIKSWILAEHKIRRNAK